MEEPENDNVVICGRLVRHMEITAYSEVLSALRAQGGLNDAKLQTMAQLRSVLLISAERHKAEVRRVANDEKLSTIARSLNPGMDVTAEWLEEGRRENPLIPQSADDQGRNEDISDDVAEIAQQINAENAIIAQLTRDAEKEKSAIEAAANLPSKRGRKRKVDVPAIKRPARVEHPGLMIANKILMEGSKSSESEKTGETTSPKAKPKAGKPPRLYVRTKKFGDLGPLKARSFKEGPGRKMGRRGGANVGRPPVRPRLDLKSFGSMVRQNESVPGGSLSDEGAEGTSSGSQKKKASATATEVKANSLFVKNGKLKRGRPRKYPVQGLLQSPSGMSRSGRKLNPTPKMSVKQEKFSDFDSSSDSEVDALFNEFMNASPSVRSRIGSEFASNEELHNPSGSRIDSTMLGVAGSSPLLKTSGVKQISSIRDVVNSVAKVSTNSNKISTTTASDRMPQVSKNYLQPTLSPKMQNQQSFNSGSQQLIGYTSVKSSPQVHKVFTSGVPVTPNQPISLPTMKVSSSAGGDFYSPQTTTSPLKSGLTLLAEYVKFQKSTSFSSPTPVSAASPSRRVVTAFSVAKMPIQRPAPVSLSPNQAFIVLSANGSRIHQSQVGKGISPLPETTGSQSTADHRSDPQQKSTQPPMIVVQSVAQQRLPSPQQE